MCERLNLASSCFSLTEGNKFKTWDVSLFELVKLYWQNMWTDTWSNLNGVKSSRANTKSATSYTQQHQKNWCKFIYSHLFLTREPQLPKCCWFWYRKDCRDPPVRPRVCVRLAGTCESRLVWKDVSVHFLPHCVQRLLQMSMSSAAQLKQTRMWQYQAKYSSRLEWLVAVLVSHSRPCSQQPERYLTRASQPITARQMICLPFPLYCLTHVLILLLHTYIFFRHTYIHFLLSYVIWNTDCMM